MIENESVLGRAARAPDTAVPYGDNAGQVADVWFGDTGAEGRCLLVMVHGGFWRPQYGSGQLQSMAAELAAQGWTVAVVGYRRIPANPDVSVDDVTLALDRLSPRVQHHNGKVVLIGHSAGGQLALVGALRTTGALSGVLALAPAADLQLAHELDIGDGAVATFVGGDPASREDLDPRRLRTPSVATRLLHGEFDEVVPLILSQSYQSAHPGTALTRLACGHFALIDPESTAWEAVLDEVRVLDGWSHD